MHDRDPFRAPRREPKPGTFHRPAHGFGTKPAPEAKEKAAPLHLEERGSGHIMPSDEMTEPAAFMAGLVALSLSDASPKDETHR